MNWMPVNGRLLVRPESEGPAEGVRCGVVVAVAGDVKLGGLVVAGWTIRYYAQSPETVDGMHIILADQVTLARPPSQGDA